EYLKVASTDVKDAARRDTIDSSIKFADAFPQHEQAAVVLAAAAEDAYEMKDLVFARDSGRHLFEKFPNAAAGVRRDAWLVVAHSTFGLAEYADAEQAYGQVLEATPEGDASRAGLVENLAASIYKQGEQANQAGDYRTAANHFVRVKQVAPTSKICAAAEYDAGAALLRLKDWTAAAQVLDEFRRSFPEHELQKEATKQIAYAYQQAGQVAQSAGAAGSERTDRTRNVAARAALELSKPIYEQFASLKLVQPFERSLQEKQRCMDTATKAFGALVDYQVGEVTAAATFYTAEIYANFGQALRESERPANLGVDALKDYDQQLADAAHPLEAKAIAVHEKNLELMRRGLNNAWTQKSVERLAALEPDRYARAEISSGFLGSLERYVYQPPPRAVAAAFGNPPAPVTASGPADSASGQALAAGAGNANSH